MSGERILVVDDSLEMREFISSSILANEGYTVVDARNGLEGLQSAQVIQPDLIITDLSMPEMDGLTMLEGLRKRGLNMPAILMTAEGSEDVAVRALRAGVMDYFVKPFDPFELADAVKRVLGATRIGTLRTGVPDQRRLQVLNTLIAIGKSITSLLELESILARVVEAAVFLANAEEGTLMLIDPASGDLYIHASKNVEEGLRNTRLKVQDSLAGRVISTGQPLLVGGEGPHKIKTAYLVRSLLYVPMKVGGRVIGVLGVHNRLGDTALSPESVGSITALADYAAIAIVNAQLYQETDSERSKLNRILNQIQDAVMLLDYENRIALSNPVAREFLGVAPGKPNETPITEIIKNEDLLELLASASNGNDARLLQGEIRQDKQTYNAYVSEIEGVGRLLVMQNITDLKELDRIKSELVTMVSHDLRSPLTSILSYISLLGRVGDLNEQQQEFLRQAQQSVYSITSLINDLLDVGQIEAGLDRKREAIALEQLVRQAVDAAQRQASLKQQAIEFHSAKDVPLVLGSPARLRQVFTNLLDNAIKYTPEGGRIRVGVFEQGGQVVSMVQDTGIGIPPEDQPHVFDKFYRVQDVSETHVGTGIGLSIVKSVVENHNGRVWVQSAPGQGTTFTLMFPPYVEQGDPT